MRLEVSKGGGQNADEFGRDFHHQEREQKPYAASQVPDVDVETAFQKKIGIRKANDTTRKPPKSPLHLAKAAKLLGVTQPKVSALRHYKLAGFSVERLMTLLTALDQDVEIVIKRKPRSRRAARISVVAARARTPMSS
jgi:hypothetical protein